MKCQRETWCILGAPHLGECFRVLGIEQEPDYARIARARMKPATPGQTSDDYFTGQLPLFGEPKPPEPEPDSPSQERAEAV